jgi:thiol-disulfide isomerase/thioredoxin
MFKTTLTLVMAMLCLNFSSKAQDLPDKIRPLKIGDTIPEALWNMPLQVINHPQGKKTITLNEYRNKKLIIIDFWATWCTACIANMPRLHELQQSTGSGLEIIPVTKQLEALVFNFLQENKSIKNLKMMSIVQDSVLGHLFPHQLIPHYVWIDKSGAVIAFTDGSEIQQNAVSAAINGQMPTVQQKFDQKKDKPLFSSEALPEKQVSFYSMLIKGKYPGFGGGVNYRQKGDTTYGILLTNSSLSYIYEIAARAFLPGNANKRTVLEVSQPDKLLHNRAQDPSWDKENLYTYELRVPFGMAEQLYPVMLEQLNQISGYYGKVERRKIKCLVLTAKSGIQHLLTKGEKYANTYRSDGNINLLNASTLVLTGRLNNALPLLVIDETGESGKIDLNIRLKPNDLAAIQRELNQKGFLLTQAVRETQLLVITDKAPQ